MIANGKRNAFQGVARKVYIFRPSEHVGAKLMACRVAGYVYCSSGGNSGFSGILCSPSGGSKSNGHKKKPYQCVERLILSGFSHAHLHTKTGARLFTTIGLIFVGTGLIINSRRWLVRTVGAALVLTVCLCLGALIANGP